MTRPRHRAWRFVHPDLDVPTDRPGITTTASGMIAMVSEEASIRQAVLLLLSTTPGERVMRPDYGCELSSLVFAPNDESTAGLAIHYVRQALLRWEPRIEILKIDARRAADQDARLDIQLEYRVRSLQLEDSVGISLDLAAEGGT
jgi:uncharacterized protein